MNEDESGLVLSTLYPIQAMAVPTGQALYIELSKVVIHNQIGITSRNLSLPFKLSTFRHQLWMNLWISQWISPSFVLVESLAQIVSIHGMYHRPACSSQLRPP